ncbi:hypothetical protein C8A05DRAFT_31007 [Staphylotrichum tortipilum]|uniref:Uncharacterized protein n=1 Tax=Staphylotrichum tortipilum TaxID=2831512 RepID=A0AAN6MSH8_9PEZI|nr:hypothetical protein C8A05DRAFT_31007 [Staphylotrichum longicolle]
MSAWKKEVADAILKPMPSLELCGLEPKANSDEGSITVVYQSDIADKSPVRAKGEKLWLNTMMTPRTERHTLVSPQPQPQSSLPKIEKLSGLSNSNIPAFRETTPRGHNSGKKIRRLTGLEVHGEALDRYGEVSPLSSNGNDYGYGGPITAVFALDYYDVATVPSALPRPPSSFDFDSDSSPRTVGTPETGGSIPISIGSDTSGADAKASTATTTKSRHHRRRASFIAKVFGRAASTPNTPVPPVPPLSAAPKSTPLPALSPHSSSSSPSPPRTNPPRPVRTFPPLYPSLPRAATTAAAATTTTTTTTTMTVIKPPGRRQTDPTLTKTGLKAKKSMSALVGAAAGLIGVKSRSTGSGSWKGRAGEMTEEERRRWKEEVMKTIQVVPATGGEPGMLGEGVRMGGQQQQVRVGVGLGLI